MKSTAIHQHDDWYLIELPGYGDIPKGQIEVNVKISKDEFNRLDYKALRGGAILEYYHEKRERELFFEPGKELIMAFDKKFGTNGIRSMDDVMKNL